MSINILEFVVLYPEFENVDLDKLEMTLNFAKIEISEKVFNDKYKNCVYLLTAHKLVTSPYGTDQRIQPTNDSIYFNEFRRVRNSICKGYSITQ